MKIVNTFVLVFPYDVYFEVRQVHEKTMFMIVIRRYLSHLLNLHAYGNYDDAFSYTLPSGFGE